MRRSFGLTCLILSVIVSSLLMSNGYGIACPVVSQESGFSRSTGAWLYVGGAGHGNYSRIQDAIDNASAGDTVFVYHDSSPYSENLEVSKPIHLRGENKETTVINGGHGNQSDTLIYVHDTSGFSVCNFTLVNYDTTKLTDGIWAMFCPDIMITDCLLTHEASNGISVQFSPRAIITHNVLYKKAAYGIYIRGCDSAIIEYNLIRDNLGLYSDSGYGLYIDRLNNGSITHNVLLNNSNCGLFMEFSNVNHVVLNSFENNEQSGILICNSDQNVVMENNIVNNSDCICFSASYWNHWEKNYWGKPGVVKLVPGYYITNDMVPVPRFIFRIDWHPAKTPYQLG